MTLSMGNSVAIECNHCGDQQQAEGVMPAPMTPKNRSLNYSLLHIFERKASNSSSSSIKTVSE